MEKKYTAPLTSAQLRNAEVGNVFYHGGRKMRITRVEPSYLDSDGKRVFDAWAEPYQEPAA